MSESFQSEPRATVHIYFFNNDVDIVYFTKPSLLASHLCAQVSLNNISISNFLRISFKQKNIINKH